MKIGAILIRLRNGCRLTQRDVAEFVGVRQNTYQSWECDQTSVKVDFLPKLAQVLEVDIIELLPSDCVKQKQEKSTAKPQPSEVAPDYRDEVIAMQKRVIELQTARIVDLEGRLRGGGGKIKLYRIKAVTPYPGDTA